MNRIMLTVLAALLLAPFAFAQSTWNGGTSTNWGDAANWSAGVPTATTDAVISGSAATMPTLNVAATCQSLTIQTGATLSGAGQTLTVNGNWINNGTYTAGTSTVVIGGATDSTIAGTSTTSFWMLHISKVSLAVRVTLEANINVNSTGNPSMNIIAGTFVTNGRNATIGGTLSSSGSSSSEFSVTVGGIVNLSSINQNNPGLAFLSVYGGTLNISGTHTIFNAGPRSDVFGGNVNYTGTGVNLSLSTNNVSYGWFASGGNISFAGNITSSIACYFYASGTSIVRFVGTTASTVQFFNSTINYQQEWRFNDLRVEKTGAGSATFSNPSTGLQQGSVTIAGTLTVNAGTTATFSPRFDAGFQLYIGAINNAGTLNLNAPAANTVYAIGGNITNTGTLTAGANTRVQLSGAGATTLSGNMTFAELYCTLPGKTINFGAGNTYNVTSRLQLEGISGTNVLLRSTSAGVAWNLNNTGTVVANYCDVQDSNAAANVTALSSTNSGNNTNWTFGGSASAHTWTGATSTDWNTASNWSAASVPTAANDVIIPNTGALPFAPTLAATSNCNSIVIQAGGVLNGGSGTLNVNGSWSNSGTFNPATSIVIMAGSNPSVITGPATQTFNRLAVSKSARTVEVLQRVAVTATYATASTAAPGLDIRRGTFRNAGFNLTVGSSYVSSTSPAQGDLFISGGTCSFGYVYQLSALKRFEISAGTVSIVNTHTVSGGESVFLMTGGTLNYNSTSSSSLSVTGSGGPGAGFEATGGTINFNGGFTVSGTMGFLYATGTSAVRFIGTAAVTNNIHNTTGSGIQFFRIDDCRVEKSAAVTVSFNASTGSYLGSPSIGALTVNPTNTATFGAVNFGAGFGWRMNSITGGGTVNFNASPLSISGNITATFNGGAATEINIIGTAPSSLTGNMAFGNINCRVPGRRINFGAGNTFTINGQLFFEGTAASPVELRSTSTGVQWNLVPTGVIVARYCDVQDSNASSTVYAQPGGINSGNNVNWVFGGAVSVLASSGAFQAAWSNDVSGLVSGTFLLENLSAGVATLNSITFTASGTGNDLSAYTEVALYRDNPSAGTPGAYDAADTLFGTALTAFTADNGTATYTGTLALAASSTNRFFLVVKFNGTPLPTPGQTFRATVSAINITGAPVTGVPSSPMAGHQISSPVLNVTIPSITARPVTSTYAGPGGIGFEYARFTVTNTSPGPAVINFLQLYGYTSTSPHLNSIASVRLFEDTNANNGWDNGVDAQVGATFTSWTSFQNFTYSGSAGTVAGNEVRTFFVVVTLNGSSAPPNGVQLGFYVSSSSSISVGTLTGNLGTIRYGVQIQNAALHVIATPGTAVPMLPNSSSPAEIGKFTMTNISAATSVTLNSITLTATGTGNDLTAYSTLRLYRDTNSNGFWDGADTQFGATLTAFSANDGTATFTQGGGVAIAGSTTQTFFVVGAMNGSTPPTAGQTFRFFVSSFSSSVASDSLGLPSHIMQGITVVSSAFTFADASGATATDVFVSSTDNVLQNFTVTLSSSGNVDLQNLTVTHAGTGNPTTAYTQVRLFLDNGDGVFTGADTQANTNSASFSGSPATASFTLSAGAATFTPSQNKRFFVVVDFNASPSVGETFKCYVSAATASGGGTALAGIPTPSTSGNSGLIIVAPTLTVSATVGTAVNVYANDQGPGSGGRQMGLFTITNNAAGVATLTQITLQASGNADDSTDYSEVAVYRDDAAGASPGSFDAADTLIGSAATVYPVNNGTLTFNVQAGEQSFAASASRTYFVVVKLSGQASPTETLQVAVSDITVGGGSAKAGVPSSVMSGLVILAPSFVFADNSSATQGQASLGGTGYTIQQFTVSYPNGPNNTLTSITVQPTGTGNDQNDFATVALYRDANANAQYDAGTDVLVTSFAAFPADDTAASFTITGTESQWAAGDVRQFFIVVDYNTNGTNNTTFATQVQGASGGSTGTTYNALPQPSSGPTAGLLLLANNITVTVNGPGTATTVNNTDQGPGGIGRVILDFTLTTVAGNWTVSTLTFTGQGTANHQTAYNSLALYEDANTNGTYDGAAGGDSLAVAAAGTSFNATNEYTATLTNTAFPPSTTRRFFLVGQLAGTATTGQTLNANITGQTSTPPAGGSFVSLPSATSTALIIDAAALTTRNSASAPAAATVEGGTAQGLSLAFFEFTATNNNVTVNGITLTTAGSGDWTTDLAAANGVEVYQDNGNNVFDGAPTDTLVFSGAGANGTLTCNFTTPINVPNNGSRSIWVRVNLLASAGASVPETFTASIANAADVNITGATSILGTPAPNSNALSVVIFAVTTFTPTFDVQAGGAAITIDGSGFLAPLTLTIGGVVCPGTPVIGAGGTQITGFLVPPGSGSNLPIVLTNGPLGNKTLTQTFSYAGGSTVGGGGGGGSGGCSTSEEPLGLAWLAALALLAVAARMGLRTRKS